MIMPKDKKVVSILSDLGRPTLRGIRKCPKCGTVNGTRGRSCKNINCDVVFRGKQVAKPNTLDACKLIELPGYKKTVYSVRIKYRGPEYRTFVELPRPGEDRKGQQSQKVAEVDERPKCFYEACSRVPVILCQHIQSAKKCTRQAKPLKIKSSVLSSLNIPASSFNVLSEALHCPTLNLSIHRVTKFAFVVCLKRGEESAVPAHVVFLKTARTEFNVRKKFKCSCGSLGDMRQDNKMEDTVCVHYFACIATFASDELMMSEFENLLSFHIARESPAQLVNQLQLVSEEGKSVEIDGTTLSVEIIRDNLSLLESIAAADENNLTNVQTLDGVLSDQIIVTNVEDALGFGDGAVLESLDDQHGNVCHIFSNNSQTMIQLSYPSQEDTFSRNSPVFLTDEGTESEKDDNSSLNNFSKRRKNNVDPSLTQKRTKSKGAQDSPNAVKLKSLSRQATPNKRKPSLRFSPFELWIGGVNDRINCSMNYQLPSKPEPFVHYIPAEFYEQLRDRLSSLGGKKRRLPNQTIVFHRTDRPPLGTFTKHVWKIINILNLTTIFHSEYVPLKIKQYFIQNSNGNYVEWTNPMDESDNNEKHQKILPVLHSTHLKCGRNFPSDSKECTPVIIEWVPDILQASGLGELTIRLEFHKIESTRDKRPLLK